MKATWNVLNKAINSEQNVLPNYFIEDYYNCKTIANEFNSFSQILELMLQNF